MDMSMDPLKANDFKTYATVDNSTDKSCDALFDSTTTCTILRDRGFFNFSKLSTWQTKNLITIARSTLFHFKEEPTKVILPKGNIITCMHAMYPPLCPKVW